MLRRQPRRCHHPPRFKRGLILTCTAFISAVSTVPVQAQVPSNRIHISLGLGGYVMVGVGFTHWIEQHHALEATVFPIGFPGEGFLPFAVKAGYAWTPSDEVWRAKLGGDVLVLFHERHGDESRFTPLLAFTPGLQYDPTDERSFRIDFWMSYYLTEKVFAPTGLEILHSWKD